MVSNFNGIKDARRFCANYCQGTVTNGCSMRGEPGGQGKAAYVSLTKTKAYYNLVKKRYDDDQAERRLLQGLLAAAGADAACSSSSSSSSASSAAVKRGHDVIDLTDDPDDAENADNGATKKPRT